MPRRSLKNTSVACAPWNVNTVEGHTAPESEVIRGYGSAVRRARTDDGRPPLAAAGLQLHDRLTAIAQSLERVEKRGPCPQSLGA